MPSPRDPGLAAERTALAWSRSALAIVAVAGLLAKTGAESGNAAIGLAIAGLLTAMAAGVWLAGRRADAERRQVETYSRRRTKVALGLVSAVSVTTAAAALALTLLGR